MNILVLSDSHSALSYMRRFLDAVKPDAVVHLGDYFEDGSVMAEEYPTIPFYQVPGNCDKYRDVGLATEVLATKVCGVKLYMTHGHLHQVKYGLGNVIAAGRRAEAQAVLFGHTHEACCRQEEDGLWVINPGSSGSAALLSVDHGKILNCRIIR